MNLVGFRDGNRTVVGDLRGNGTVVGIADTEAFWMNPVGASARPDHSAPVGADQLQFVAPLRASARIICVGLNYLDHVSEGPFIPPKHPEYFARWSPAIGTSGQPVTVPRGEPGLDWEAELAVIIGEDMFEVDVEDALSGVFGYAAFNDLTARRAQHRGLQWTLGKNVDSSGILGPITPAHQIGDPREGWQITAKVNGEVVQQSRTDKLIFDVATLVADLSSVLTLHPGDVIATGTPDGVGHRRNPPRFLGDGDTVTVEIEGLQPISTPINARMTTVS
ncbi:fumarylacetoacetate hydrolase family protein [Mycolicibacterium bacteremicum]|uniref:fumarylacetoacetate hydrolase family protein n=1 Tax=Mycolicibacterium bacteremicum TaxID=564198 RepID=UPI0026F17A8C|nr:fumarylacetoacetate hydrolase family protein [Mycolicibacterium bacteremicum]